MKSLLVFACLSAALCMMPCTADDAPPAPTKPALLGDSSPADLDVSFADNVTAQDDGEWRADVVEALRYLHSNQLDIIKRLEKVESALLKVSTPTGNVVRQIPITNGVGQFYLAPGETVVGFADALSGKWTTVGAPAAASTATYAAKQSYGSAGTSPVSYGSAGGSAYSAQPVQTTTYRSTNTSMTVAKPAAASGRVRGSFRLFRGGCCG